MKHRISLLILAVILLIALTSCGLPTGGKTPDGEKPPEKLPEKPFFELSNLNYNAAYQAADSSEKGFILFDNINFNLIKYTAIPSRNPIFEIFYNDLLIETVQMSPYGTEYSDYMFEKTGEYTVKVYTKFGGDSKEGQFKLKVQPGGFPDRVEFELLNRQNQIVPELVGGEIYTLRAKVFSGDTLLEQDNEKFSSAWSGGIDGAREKTVEIANQIADSEIGFSFNYSCILPNGSKNMSAGLTVPLKNNYEGIAFSYGQQFVAASATLDAIEDTVNFMDFSSAKHVFKNGDEEDIAVQYSAAAEIGEVAAFLKYNGDTEYHQYKRNMYNVAERFTNYVSNGTVYQFDPGKASAQIYLALCYKEKFSGGYSRKYSKIEGSDAHITITKSTPESFSVTSISGKEKPESNNTGNVSFENRLIENNSVEVKVLVSENYIGGAAKQHFRPEVVLGGDFLMGDFFYEIENDTGFIGYNAVERYFFAPRAGGSRITIKSCFGDAEYTFAVSVVNPIVDYEIDLRKRDFSDIPNYFCGQLDIAPYVAVIQNYYNNTSDWRRMAAQESLKYYDDGEKSIEYFAYRDEMYVISIKLFENDKQKSTNVVSHKFFVSPDLQIQINDESYRMSQMEKVRQKYTVKDDDDKSLDFIGDIPEMSINRQDGENVVSSIPAEEPPIVEIKYLMGIDAYYIYFTGFYRKDGFETITFEKVIIARILINRTE